MGGAEREKGTGGEGAQLFSAHVQIHADGRLVGYTGPNGEDDSQQFC